MARMKTWDRGLFRAFLNGDDDGKAYKEVQRLINTVLSIHQGRFNACHEEMGSSIVLKLLECRDKYDPARDPYPWLFTFIRNEASNYVSNERLLLRREWYGRDVHVAEEACSMDDVDEDPAPVEIEKYLPYLLNEVDYDLYRVNKNDATMLIVYLLRNDGREMVPVPAELRGVPDLARILYNMCMKLMQ